MSYPKSPHEEIDGIVYFRRMLDKIRIHARGELPEVYVPNLGIHFDDRACKFLGVPYDALKEQVLAGKTDEEVLAWAYENGRKPSEEEIEIWSGFMRKRGWKDAGTETLVRRKQESGFADRDDIETMFAYLDADEGR